MSSNTADCWVCGVATPSTCRPCARAGNPIFFCGRDRQKLVWKTHKRVCGRPGFRPPPLTEEEAAYVSSIWGVTVPPFDVPNPPVGALVESLGMTETSFVRTFTGDPSKVTTPAHLEFLNFIRWVSKHVMAQNRGVVVDNESNWIRPFYAFALFGTDLPATEPSLSPRIEGYAAEPAWIGHLQHRLLVFLSVWVKYLDWSLPMSATKKDEIPEELVGPMTYTRSAVFACLREEVEPAENGKEWAKRARAMIAEVWKVTETTLG